MSLLFDNLPDGTFHLKNFLDEKTQLRFVELCRELCRTHPLMQPKTRTGYDLALQVTSWGKVGWFGEYGKYLYLDRHENMKPFPPIPDEIGFWMYEALARCGWQGNESRSEVKNEFCLETVLMNWYPANSGKLGKHQDVTEQDRVSPIVTFSLGDSCVFNVGSTFYNDKGVDIELKSGDCVVMGGESRLAYHEVKRLIPNTSNLFKGGGRISLTGRKVFI